MATFAQLTRGTRAPNRRRYNRSPKMEGCPQKIGICIKVLTTKPKKPNSAIRKIIKVALPTGYNIRAVVPGSGHRIQEYNTIWVQAGRARDIPGIHYRVIRGKGDVEPPHGFYRFNRRSKFAITNWVIQLEDLTKKHITTIYVGTRLRSLRNEIELSNGLPKTWHARKYYFSKAFWRAKREQVARELREKAEVSSA